MSGYWAASGELQAGQNANRHGLAIPIIVLVFVGLKFEIALLLLSQ